MRDIIIVKVSSIGIIFYVSNMYTLFISLTNKLNAALKSFNMARRDAVYGELSLAQMIEIYLNPTGVTAGGEALEVTDERLNEELGLGIDARESNSLKAAKKLIEVR